MNKAKSAIRMSLQANWPVLLVGQPGIGKTDVCHQIAEELGYNIIVEVATTADPADARGLPAIIEGRADYQPYGIMRNLIEAERPTLCLIDDIGHASGEVQKAYMHLVLARRAGQKEISKYVKFVAATNDIGQKAGIRGIISPLQNRFFQVKVSPHIETWVEWAQEKQLSPEVIAFVRSTPVLFDSFNPPKGIEATCTPRSLKMLSDFVLSGAESTSIFQGCVGKEIALQFSAYRELYKELSKLEEIIKNPKKAPIPKQLDRKYALCAAIACETKNWGPLITYLSRLNSELQVMCVSDAIARHSFLKKDQNIKNWMIKNKDKLL